MTAEGQAHRQDGVSGAQQGRVRRQYGRTPRVGLDVGVIGAEEGLGAVDGDAFGGVDEFAAAVMAGAGIPLGVLVRQR